MKIAVPLCLLNMYTLISKVVNAFLNEQHRELNQKIMILFSENIHLENRLKMIGGNWSCSVWGRGSNLIGVVYGGLFLSSIRSCFHPSRSLWSRLTFGILEIQLLVLNKKLSSVLLVMNTLLGLINEGRIDGNYSALPNGFIDNGWLVRAPAISAVVLMGLALSISKGMSKNEIVLFLKNRYSVTIQNHHPSLIIYRTLLLFKLYVRLCLVDLKPILQLISHKTILLYCKWIRCWERRDY